MLFTESVFGDKRCAAQDVADLLELTCGYVLCVCVWERIIKEWQKMNMINIVGRMHAIVHGQQEEYWVLCEQNKWFRALLHTRHLCPNNTCAVVLKCNFRKGERKTKDVIILGRDIPLCIGTPTVCSR